MKSRKFYIKKCQAGTSDDVSVWRNKQDKNLVYIIVTNCRYGYIGIEKWYNDKKMDDRFIQNYYEYCESLGIAETYYHNEILKMYKQGLI